MRRVLSLLPPLLLGLAALVLVVGWNQLPASWPIHWGLDGQPNGWATKSFGSAFMPLGLGLGMWLFFEVIATYTQTRTTDQLSPPDSRRLAGATADLVRWTATPMAAVMAFLSAALPFWPELGTSRLLPGLILGGILAAIGLGLVAYLRVLGQLTLPPAYKGLLYNDPHDQRLWVPKLLGAGWTINFGHPHALPATLALLGLLLTPLALLMMAR